MIDLFGLLHQANIKTVKYQIVRLMRTLIQVVHYCCMLWFGSPFINSTVLFTDLRCTLQICTTLEALPKEVNAVQIYQPLLCIVSIVKG